MGFLIFNVRFWSSGYRGRGRIDNFVYEVIKKVFISFGGINRSRSFRSNY